MDVKLSAKSKREHSLHHKPKKPPQTAAASISTNPPRRQGGSQKNPPLPSQRRGPPSLPSNWDRYEEDHDFEPASVVGESSGTLGKKADGDAVKPRSKGADFGHLVSEAQNELRNRRGGTQRESFLSFHGGDIYDFDEGFSSILSIHGKSLVSWNVEDNFVVDDHTNSSYEASFLSIDLDSLAEHLSKLDVSKRLFIEADLLPAELPVDPRELAYAGKWRLEMQEPYRPINSTHIQMLPGFVGRREYYGEECAENSRTSDTGDILTGPGLGLSGMDEANENVALPSIIMPVDIVLAEDHPLLTTSERVPILDTFKSTVLSDENAERVDYQEKTTRFEAAAAEAELDMLLDSFGETETPDSFGVHGKPGSSFQRKLPSSQDHGSAKDVSAINVLDDLLSETSHMPNQMTASSSQQEGRGSLNPSSQDHGSTKTDPAFSDFDVSIDDLLSETSYVSNQKLVSFSQQERPGCSNQPNTVSNLLDDLDSLLDNV